MTENNEQMLNSLRMLLAREPYLEVNYLEPNYATVRPLVILLQKFACSIDPEFSKRIRMNILSTMLGKRVNTTYELTIYQCSTILNFLEADETGQLSERAKEFLSFCEEHP